MHSIDKDGGPTWRATSNSGGTQPCRIVGCFPDSFKCAVYYVSFTWHKLMNIYQDIVPSFFLFSFVILRSFC